jgi:recombination directionality factor gp3-like protein
MGAKGKSKDGKEIPVKLKTWRLTSANLEALSAASKLWGGEIEEWEQGYSLITETAELPVLVPEQELEASQWYTLYSGGGILRRCDGTTEFQSDGPCICLTEIEGTDKERQCSVTTHLLVVLPQLPDIGVWRLTTHGWNAASELANTVDVLQQFVARGKMPEAVIAIESRTSKRDGQTRNFIVPVLRIPRSLQELGAGMGQGPAELPGTPFDPETGEILEATPELSARAEQGETAGAEPALAPAVASSAGENSPAADSMAASPAEPSDEDGSVAPSEPETSTANRGDARGEAPSPAVDDGTPATPEQWKLLERHKTITATKILTRVRHLFPDNPPKAKSEITKFQFAKAFAALADSKAGVRRGNS